MSLHSALFNDVLVPNTIGAEPLHQWCQVFTRLLSTTHLTHRNLSPSSFLSNLFKIVSTLF
ncbi:hypothetical protein HMPREF9148_01136 [Prevotella sp. F0091]|nr:hypothetical protein HMPREF9148_01136 [Prevotella sp. F0091]